MTGKELIELIQKSGLEQEKVYFMLTGALGAYSYKVTFPVGGVEIANTPSGPPKDDYLEKNGIILHEEDPERNEDGSLKE